MFAPNEAHEPEEYPTAPGVYRYGEYRSVARMRVARRGILGAVLRATYDSPEGKVTLTYWGRLLARDGTIAIRYAKKRVQDDSRP